MQSTYAAMNKRALRPYWMIWCLLVASLAIAAVGVDASDGGDDGSHANRFVFFGEGVRLTAVFGDGEVRLIFSDGQEARLEQAVSASGARYTDGETLFWNKGDEALLEWRGETYTTRMATVDNDVWERARAAGIDFRAVGNEPGWLVEIRNGDQIHVVLDYGMTTVTTPLSEFHIDYRTGERTYTAKPPLAPLPIVVSVAPEACYDAMSGEGFSSTVTLVLPDAGRSYSGCGRDL